MNVSNSDYHIIFEVEDNYFIGISQRKSKKKKEREREGSVFQDSSN